MRQGQISAGVPTHFLLTWRLCDRVNAAGVLTISSQLNPIEDNRSCLFEAVLLFGKADVSCMKCSNPRI
ncbi:unnamed protein product, partial [Cyprideis torosa]